MYHHVICHKAGSTAAANDLTASDPLFPVRLREFGEAGDKLAAAGDRADGLAAAGGDSCRGGERKGEVGFCQLDSFFLPISFGVQSDRTKSIQHHVM